MAQSNSTDSETETVESGDCFYDRERDDYLVVEGNGGDPEQGMDVEVNYYGQYDPKDPSVGRTTIETFSDSLAEDRRFIPVSDRAVHESDEVLVQFAHKCIEDLRPREEAEKPPLHQVFQPNVLTADPWLTRTDPLPWKDGIKGIDTFGDLLAARFFAGYGREGRFE